MKTFFYRSYLNSIVVNNAQQIVASQTIMFRFIFCLFLFLVYHQLLRLNSSTTTIYPWIKQVHVVSMTHLDVGFTNFAANVCSLYFNEHLPNAARLAQELRDRGGNERFIFTTHPWILLEFFDNIAQCTNERPNRTTIELVEKAIKQGDITWHAHAFSMFIPMMDKNLFNISLSISSILDDRFYQNRKTSASHKDDMGHPISTIPIFADNGIKSVHIGVNLNCHGADLPPAFIWKHEETNTELLVMMYNKPTATTPCSAEACIYGGDVVLPGFDQAMIYHFTLDNTGPPHNITDVIRVWSQIQTHYPNAEIIASNLETFSQSLLESYKDQLPIITDEWGTTWLYGVAADPYKQSAYRQISRLLNEQEYSSSPSLFNYTFRLLKNPEHNWGLCTGCYLKKENYAFNYHNDEFSHVRNGSDFQLLEQGWKEARSYLYPLSSSDPSLINRINNTLKELELSIPDLSQFIPISLPINRTKDYFLFQTTLFSVGFNYTSGAIVFLQDKQGRNFSNINNTLGNIQYKTYSNDDFNRFNLQYNPNCGPPCGDFAKPGLTNSPSRTSYPYVVSMWKDNINKTFLIELTFPNEIIEDYGGSKTIWLNYTFTIESKPTISIELQWFNKTATRLPESIWIEFNPILPVISNTCDQWKIDVLGYDVNPSKIVDYGSRRLHAIGHNGVRFYDDKSEIPLFTLYSLDAPLLSIGSSDYLLNFDNSIPDCQGINNNGLFINLHNNLWNTAFPIYYEQDAKFRFKMDFLPEWMQIIQKK
ncbi:unnamed protein product [Adineta steineri]|uniref:Glycoside hydrolase family 38 N-terminal domain-containing protein n=1 Tax=Adineta steineri TaxID=433720 RepID=A0A818QQF0_9BILA|nr:unnamed protein product [Adineta steineri]CAF3642785.1 unnamed protein product [Adineta steineri]